MRKSFVVTLILGISALATSSAFALAAVSHRAENAGTPAVEHVKPAPAPEATPPVLKAIVKRAEVVGDAAKPAAASAPAPAKAPQQIGLDLSTMRCTKRPLSSGKPGETVTVCE